MNLTPPQNCKQWNAGQETLIPPLDESFLNAIVNAGYLAFVAEGSLFGGRSVNRIVMGIHRGGGRRWEVTFHEQEQVALGVFTTDLHAVAQVSLLWLDGATLQEVSVQIDALPQWRRWQLWPRKT